MSSENLLVFSGNANRPLAQAVCSQLGVPMGKALVGKFSDGEVQVEIEENVRGQDVFVIQPTSAPTAEHFMELLALIDALKRASAQVVTAVVPYFGYARQDRRPRSARVPITAKVAARMFSAVNCDRVLTVDLHAEQIQGFFDMPVDNVYASPLLLADIWRSQGTDNLIVVSPDVGGVVRARAIAKRLDDADLAIIDKRRPKANVATVMNIIGDVAGKTCVLVDDIVDTAGTLCAAAAALKEQRRDPRGRVLHAPGAVGRGDRQHQRLEARRAGGDRHDPAVGSGAGLQADPPAERGGVAGGDGAAHRHRRVGQHAVRGLRCERGRGSGIGVANSADARFPSGNDTPPGRGQRAIAPQGASQQKVMQSWHIHNITATSRDGRGQGCEPPPPSQRPGPGHRLRRQGRPAERPARAQRALARHARTSGSTPRS